MRVDVGGTAVAVGGRVVAVGGTEVAVGGRVVAVGGTEVAVGGGLDDGTIEVAVKVVVGPAVGGALEGEALPTGTTEATGVRVRVGEACGVRVGVRVGVRAVPGGADGLGVPEVAMPESETSASVGLPNAPGIGEAVAISLLPPGRLGSAVRLPCSEARSAASPGPSVS